MTAKWEIRDFGLSGIFAAITFGLAFVLGAGIITATGIPATGGVANIFIAVLIVLIGMQICPKFGFGTLTIALIFTFAIPTVIGGPPGAYKVVNGLLIGLVLDLVSTLGHRTKLGYIAAGALGATTSIVSIYFALILLGLPGVDRLQPLILPLSVMQFLLGALAAWLAVALFERRLKKLDSVQRLMLRSGQDQQAEMR